MSGADDYVVKPFSINELGARGNAVMRRSPATEKCLSPGELEIHLGTHTAFLSGRPLELTNKEFDLMCLLLKNRGKIFSRDKILSSVWGLTIREKRAPSTCI
jgi:two-component system alkaline phosphatase synthesis response regulator PhoP